MNCELCDKTMKESVATTKRPYRYSESGLDHVLLVGVRVYECRSCREAAAAIPKIEELNRLIAVSLIEKPKLLTGAEVRFLRKQGGFPAKDFSALIGVTPSHLSRFENGKLPKLGEPTDRLIRALSREAHNDAVGKKKLQKLAALLASLPQPGKSGKVLAPVFELSKNHWKSAV